MYGSLQRRKRKVNRCIYQSKKKVNEEFGMKMNQNMNGNGNRKLLEERWKVAVK